MTKFLFLLIKKYRVTVLLLLILALSCGILAPSSLPRNQRSSIWSSAVFQKGVFRRVLSPLLSSLRPCIFCPLFFRPVCSFWKVFWRPKLTKPPKNCCLQAYTVNPMRIWKHRPSGICGTGLLENWMTG